MVLYFHEAIVFFAQNYLFTLEIKLFLDSENFSLRRQQDDNRDKEGVEISILFSTELHFKNVNYIYSACSNPTDVV